jgi:hypothetical protein
MRKSWIATLMAGTTLISVGAARATDWTGTAYFTYYTNQPIAITTSRMSLRWELPPKLPRAREHIFIT